MQPLKDKKILLTGACGNLGQALAQALCQKQADVIITDKNQRALNKLCDKILTQGGKEPMILPMDLVGATPNDFYQLANNIEEKLGGLDSIIHTAVEFNSLTEFEHYEATRWLMEMHINLNTPVFLTQALIPLLKKSQGSIIFTLENIKGLEKAYWGAYGVSKAALAHFTKTLKHELQQAHIRVHSITPKPMKSPLRAKAWPAEDASHLSLAETEITAYLKKI